MKFINWIIKALKWLKELSELIKWIIVIISLITAFGGLKSCSKFKAEKEEINTILTSVSENFKTESGKNATEINQWKVKHKALSNYSDEISVKNNVYLNELAKARQTIKDLDLKLKNAEKYANISVNSVDTFYADLIIEGENLRRIEPIKTKNIDISFFKVNDSLRVDYNYRLEVRTITYIQPKRKQNGKKHFPNWGFIWGWQHNSVAIVDDPKATINNYVEIEFKK